MSEITLITKRYDNITDFTSKVNRSVIVFKKKSLLEDKDNLSKYPKLKLNQEEIEKAEYDLLETLSLLEKLPKDADYNSDLTGLSESSDLKKFVLNNEADRKEIKMIIQNLKERKPLIKMNFILLDKIISVLDSERNLLFRKLRTARG
jgi:hypothetical protein